MRPYSITYTPVSAPFNFTAIPLDYRSGIIGANVTVTGTINYTIQQTLNNVQDTTITINWKDADDTNVVGATTSKNFNYIGVPLATRLVVNSFTPGATVQLNIVQRNV